MSIKERLAEAAKRLREMREKHSCSTRQHIGALKDVERHREGDPVDLVNGAPIALAEKSSITLRQIDAALLRIEQGTYGICSTCDEYIEPKRLEALPFALNCKGCQETIEAKKTPILGRRFPSGATTTTRRFA